MIKFKEFGCISIEISYHGENNVRGIQIDLTGEIETGQEAVLLLRRSGETAVYEKTGTLSENVLSIVWTETDAAIEGRGEATVQITGTGGFKKKSGTARTVVAHALVSNGTPPSPPSNYRTKSEQDAIDNTKIGDAPADGKTYGRKNNAWVEAAGGGGMDIHGQTTEDALADADELAFYDASATENRKTTWQNIKAKLKAYFDGLYTWANLKPASGIPKSDLASGVQTSLGKADTALQEHQSLSGYATESWVEDKGYLTEHQSLADYSTTSQMNTAIAAHHDSTKQDTISDLATIRSGAALGATAVQPESGKGLSSNDYTTAEKTKLSGIAEGAEVNVQSDWNQSDTTKDDFIKNKPSIPDDADEITYDSSAASHTSGSVGEAIATLNADKVSYPNHPSDNKFYAMKNDQWVEFSGGGGGDTAGVVAPAYSAQSTYTKGALVIQNQLLYEANVDIPVAEAWTVAHWTQTTVDAVLANYQKYGRITVSCVDEDGVQMTGITLTVKSQGDGTTLGTYSYAGTPIDIKTPYGYAYKILCSYKQGYVTPPPQRGTGVPTSTLTITYKTGVVYGFHISDSEGNPDSKVTYIQGTDAYGLTPAHMDFANDTFDYGSWENAFFIPRPCMLKYDGTVDYYLDPNNYLLKSDGVSPSHAKDTSYGGNAMMEWGQNGQKIWYKVVPDDGDDYSASIYISNEQADSDYVSWSFIDARNNPIEHFYTPIYNGSNVSNKLRSISGQRQWDSTGGASNEITAAKANNTGTDIEWYTEVEADVQLINFLLILMAKTTHTQGAFGHGHCTGGSSASNLLTTGTMNTKGMFWGSDQAGVGVKVFGMENWWGNQWRRYGGHTSNSNVQKFKMTYGTADGSTAAEYNLDGTGYLTTSTTITGTNGGYTTKMKFIARYGMFPVKVDASASTQYCDGTWFSSGTMYAYRGGACGSGLICGAFAALLNNAASDSYWYVGAAPSCKPLAQVGRMRTE